MQTPEDLVEDQRRRTPGLQSPKPAVQVLGEAAQLYGLLLSFDPAVVRRARDLLYNAAVINSRPTERGVQEIDGAHPLYGYQRLRGTPLYEMEDKDFLCLEEGMQDGLLQYYVDVSQGQQELGTMLEQLLASPNTPYFPLQQQSIHTCVGELTRGTMDYLKSVGAGDEVNGSGCASRPTRTLRVTAATSLCVSVSIAATATSMWERVVRETQNKLASVLALSFSSEPTQSSVAVVLNENGVVADHCILGKGGHVSRLDEESFLQNIQKIYEKNTVDVVVMNAALQSQTLQLQRMVEEMLDRVSVVLGVRSER